MKIKSVEAFPFHQERDASQSQGTAGSPAALQTGDSPYLWAENYPVLYSRRFETAIVRVELDSGEVGWGEAQAPVAPEVASAVVNYILAPILRGKAFTGSTEEIEALWWTMYSAMRVRGQTGGFMVDGISGVDLALWDLAGKLAKLPVSALIGRQRELVPAYLSGLPGGDAKNVARWADAGFAHVKIFHDATVDRLLSNFDLVQRLFEQPGTIAVDALWRLTPQSALELAPEVDSRRALWLEAPLNPESALEHGSLAAAIQTPIAIGESYRTTFELKPFFDAHAMRIVQPDLGRTGITEALRIARAAEELGLRVVPHVSIALGPQIAAAIHFAASIPNCPLLEFNPNVLSVANAYLKDPITLSGAAYTVPDAPGLGVTMNL
jgi:D-galactarolactone cycloisomerase